VTYTFTLVCLPVLTCDAFRFWYGGKALCRYLRWWANGAQRWQA